ncbi:MAG: hypothetical protein OQJ77_03945 [Thiovulaceae bacterium]|nr:hypothetical protein [Sulfurimonadaceae bacterium]MCW9026447.1 hypothetical protein [Sulfurimonadaceae bacterium]
MHITTDINKNDYTGLTTSKKNNVSYGLNASKFMEQVDPEIAKIFEQMSEGLDPDTKLKRAMSLSLHLTSGPMFLRFGEGDYPEGMPEELKTSIKEQTKEWDKLETEKERNVYTLDWMIESIAFEQSGDPEFEQFLKDIRKSYAGESKYEYTSRDEENDKDAALQQFKKDLTTKGAIKFLYDYNMEKIEEMVEKYKQELMKNLGENPTPQEIAEVDKLVEDYRKQLLEQLTELSDTDKNSPLNISRLEFEIMNNLDATLEEALKYK